MAEELIKEIDYWKGLYKEMLASNAWLHGELERLRTFSGYVYEQVPADGKNYHVCFDIVKTEKECKLINILVIKNYSMEDLEKKFDGSRNPDCKITAMYKFPKDKP